MNQKAMPITSFFNSVTIKRSDSKGDPPKENSGNLCRTPVLSENEEQMEIEIKSQRGPIQLLYVQPNFIIPIWGKISEILRGIEKCVEAKAFFIQTEIENIFQLHFPMKNPNVNFLNLKTAITSMPENLKNSLLVSAISNAAKLALQIQTEFPDFLEILIKDEKHHFELTRHQCAILVANMFFCTFHLQPDFKKFPQNFVLAKLFNFRNGEDQQNQLRVQKIKCILNYLIQIDKKDFRQEKILFSRSVEKFQNERFTLCDKKLCELEIKRNGRMEDEKNTLIVDFANKMIGGGVLNSGAVQEEILFLEFPELLCSILFTHELQDGESLLVSGVNMYNNVSGYEQTLKWESCSSSVDLKNSFKITCIDAQNYRGVNDTNEQWLQSEIDRELLKCYSGFNHQMKTITSGRWGCGAFQGDVELKLIIQWIAASCAGCEKLIYYDVNEKKISPQFYKWSKHLKVNQIYEKLKNYRYARINKAVACELFEFLVYY